VSRLTSRLLTLERALLPAPSRGGTLEYHHPGGLEEKALLPCDKRDEHGPDCVMSVTPTNSGVRFMRIIYGMDAG
jgi:hypothetical protein